MSRARPLSVFAGRGGGPPGRRLGQAVGAGIQRCQLLGGGEGGHPQLGQRSLLVDQAVEAGLVGIEQFGIEYQLLGPRPAYVLQHLDGQDGKGDADPQLGHTDPGPGCDQPSVAGAGEEAAPGDRRSVDSGDGGQRGPEEAAEGIDQSVQNPIGVALVVGQDFVHIDPGRKELSLPGEHEGSDVRVLLAEVDACGDLLEHLPIHGVHLVAGQGQDGRPALTGQHDPRELRLVGHLMILLIGLAIDRTGRRPDSNAVILRHGHDHSRRSGERIRSAIGGRYALQNHGLGLQKGKETLDPTLAADA